MNNDVKWIALSEALERLKAAGIGYRDAISELGGAGLQTQIIATGFPDFHSNDDHAIGDERSRLSQRTWRFMKAPLPMEGVSLLLRGDTITWIVDRNDEHVQESWRAIMLDRLSFEAWLSKLQTDDDGTVLTADEVRDWIDQYEGENSKKAWAAFRAEFGSKGGTKVGFEAVWRPEKDFRPRGRLPTQD